MGTLISQLQKLKRSVRNRRWIIKRDANNKIKEVKCIFNPDEYKTSKRAKPMVGDKKLLKILIKYKNDEKNNN